MTLIYPLFDNPHNAIYIEEYDKAKDGDFKLPITRIVREFSLEVLSQHRPKNKLGEPKEFKFYINIDINLQNEYEDMVTNLRNYYNSYGNKQKHGKKMMKDLKRNSSYRGKEL